MPVITAVFDDRETAERAAQALVFRFKIDRADVFGADANDPDGQVAWQRLAGRGIPQADRTFFHEAVTRGHAVVVADVDQGHAEEAMDALESHGAADLDDRERSFRESGWTGMSTFGGDAVFAGGSAAGLTAARGTRSDAGDADNPPGTMLSRGVDDALGTNVSGARPENETGTANPSGTMLSRGTDDALGTNASGARPEHETGAANPPGTMLSRGTDDALGTNVSGARAEHEAHGLTGRRDESIPLAEERLTIGKREVTHGRVRIRSYVVETPVEEQVRLREEHVEIERRAVDRPATDADRLFEERTIEATETAEEATVQKEARVREELSIRKESTERTETVRDTVRRTEVEIEDDRTTGTPIPGSTSPSGTTRSGV